jgi:hypothetical protein
MSQAAANACPNCFQAVPEGGDTCEGCGAWQHAGKCVFCYAMVGPADRHCGHCGNPPAGVQCGHCGAFSRVDFCVECGAGLTDQSVSVVQSLEADAEAEAALEALGKAERLVQAFRDVGYSEQVDETAPSNVSPAPCPAAASEGAAASTSTEPVSLEHIAATIGGRHASVRVARAGLGQAAAAQAAAKAAKDEAAAKLRALSERPFPTPQDARRFAGALRVLIGSRTQRVVTRGWRCRAYGVVHPNGPHECCVAGPGEWLTEIITEDNAREVALD